MTSASALLACATLYEPSPEQLERTVSQLCAMGEQRAIYDNTLSPNTAASARAACKRHGIAYLSSGSNDGLAGALNALLMRAEQAHVSWLSYLDQDSSVTGDYVARSLSTISGIELRSNVALIGCDVGLGSRPPPEAVAGRMGLKQVKFVIASGTLMRVSALRAVGGFDRRMYLDLVDHEMCLRLRANGWSIVLDADRSIAHKIGAESRLVGARLNVRAYRHPLWRRQLMWRNSVILARRYTRRFKRDMMGHLAGRSVETIAGAILYRDSGYLISALHGLREGLGQSTGRLGLDS